MEKQEFKSKWDDLARELGAEVSPETQQREEAAVLAAQEPIPDAAGRAPEEHAASPTNLPKRSTPGWDNLACELGLPPGEPAAPVSDEFSREKVRPELPPRDTTQPRRRESSGRERRPERASGERRPQQSDREPRSEHSGGNRKERQEQTEHRRERKERREPVEQRREHRQERHGRRDFDAEGATAHESESVPNEEQRLESSPPREEPQKPAAVSLWHKIFGLPAEQTAKLADEGGRSDVAAPSDLRDEPCAAGSGFADAHAEERIPSQDEADVLSSTGRPSPADDEFESSDRKRGRSRRRRGRGRGRKYDDRRPEGRATENRDRTRASEEQSPDSDDEFVDAELDDVDESEQVLDDITSDVEDGNGAPHGTNRPRGSSALQRTIPSWDEAIGYIVDTNMQSRSQRRPPSRSGSRENPSRGRQRGRRKN